MRSNLRDALFAAGLIVFLVVAAAAAFLAGIAGLAAVLAVIVAAAFGVPALGFAWRTRQKRQANSHADFLTHHDPLTEILNRTRFMRDLDEAVALGCAVAVHAVEIDRFKEINDTTGQAVGDDILQQVARRLMSVSDRTDLVARIGGNEFALAHIVESPRQVTRTAVRILGALGETYHLASRDVDASVCVGSAVAPAHGETAAALLKNVEIALAHAKSEGLGSRALFRPKMDVELQERRTLESLLHNALKSDGLELHFQPIRSASNVRLAGFEALLRLPKPGGGQVSPTQFVPVAERLGLIVPIGDWVIRRACAVATTWPSGLTISVNLSPAQFADGRIVQTVRQALEASGLAAERLELEITEGLLMSHAESTMRQLGELKALGVKIAMDDFGTGYSSLSYLWRFPFDKLKIDQSFVLGLSGGDAHVATIVNAIVALGRSLGMTVTAEGVESETQAKFLTRIGVDLLQGFYLGRPMPLASLADVILKDFRVDLREKDTPRIAALPRAVDG